MLSTESTQVPAGTRKRRFAPADVHRLFAAAAADADRRVGTDLIINELDSQWHDDHFETDSASRTRTKRSSSSVEDATAAAARATKKTEKNLSSLRTFRDQRLADLVRQRLGQAKSKSGLLTKLGGGGGGGGGASGEDLVTWT